MNAHNAGGGGICSIHRLGLSLGVRILNFTILWGLEKKNGYWVFAILVTFKTDFFRLSKFSLVLKVL